MPGSMDGAVNRTFALGENFRGPEERLTLYASLEAILRFESAFSIFEEKTKETLEAGKLADLVIFGIQNPMEGKHR